MTDTIPPPEEREDCFEALAFHRGKWRHVCWSVKYHGWSLGYGRPFIQDAGRAMHPLPPKPEGAADFYDYRE